MSIEEVKEKTRLVCKHLSDTEHGIWRTSEWNICSHIQSGLNEVFSEYAVDVELIKHDGMRPDIVIHQRGENENNLVVFQVKKNPSAQDLQDDLNKINETFFSEPYEYEFGMLISIGELPTYLPEFDKAKVGILEVYGRVLDEGDDKSDMQL